MFSPKFAAVGTLVLVGVIGLACGRAAAPPSSESKRGGTFTDVAFSDATAMQPLLTSDSASTDYNTMVYAPLLRFDPSLNLVGELAESYSFAEDRSSIVMTLRPNLTWSDGASLTSADVVFTWQKMMDPAVRFPFRSLYEGVFSSIEGPDPRTVVFNLKDACGPAIMTAAGFTPVPKHIFDGLDINETPHNMRPPVSSGPWKLDEWVKDSHAVFVANDRYWAGRPNLDRYVFKIVPDQTAAYTQFRNGESDSSTIDPPQYDEAQKLAHANTFRYFTVNAPWDYIAFNLRDPRFADIRVRQAFSHALDRDQMIDTIRQGFSRSQFSIYPVTSPVFTDDVLRYDYNPARAQQLLADAGWAPGPSGLLEKGGQPFEVRLHFNSGNKRREAIATRAQEYLRQVGVKVNVAVEEFATLTNRVNKAHDFDMAVLGWVASYDPNGQGNIWKKDSPQNGTGYENPALERLFQQGAVECSMDQRRPYYHEIQNILARDVPYIFLWTNETATGVNNRFEGPRPGPLPLRWNVVEWSTQ